MSQINNEARIKELKIILSNKPGASQFVELAQLLAEDSATRAEAREICFRGLSHDPKNTTGRLMLARLFYLDSMKEFCIRELLELKKLAPSIEPLDRLLQAMGVTVDGRDQTMSSPGGAKLPEKVVAEVDFDEGFIDVLDELDEE